MKKWFNLILLCATALSVFGHGEEWLTDFSAAKKQAESEHKRILMLFTGSDWCPACIQWEKEVFSKQEFKDYAKTNFVLVFVDFPEKKKLPKSLERANDALKDKFDVEEFPAVYILDAKGKELTHFKYQEGGLESFQKKAEVRK